LGHARSGRPDSSRPDYRRPARRSGRGACGGGRVRPGQAPTADAQSLSTTFPQPRLADRVVAGVCTLLMRPSGLVRVAIVLKPSTLLRLHRALTTLKYRRLFSSAVRKKPSPKGPQSGGHRGCRRHETAESELSLSANRATDHIGLRHSYEQGCCAAHSRRSVHTETRRCGAVVAHGPRAREG
jgi:hypothetical protein